MQMACVACKIDLFEKPKRILLAEAAHSVTVHLSVVMTKAVMDI